MDYKVQITSTPCYFGGRRYWFICPLTKNGYYCGKRVGVLYSIGKWYGCRHCGNIAYASQNRGGKFRGSSITIPDIEKMEEQVKRRFYKGQPTRKYKRLIRMNEKFEYGFAMMLARLDKNFAAKIGLS